MSITPTQLRSNLYQLLDQVIDTQKPITIIRKGIVLEISAKNAQKNQRGRLMNLDPHPNVINGDPEDLVQHEWSEYWNAGDAS